MNKIKVMFFLPNLYGGGAERVSINILRQLDLKQFQVTLVLVDKKGQLLELVPDGIDVVDLESKKTLYSIFKVRKVISELNPSIIYSTLFRTHIALYLALIGIRNKPKIFYRSPNSPKLLVENNEWNFIMKYLLDKAYQNADVIIAQTPEMKNEIEKYHHINSNKIIVFLNPIDCKLIDNSIVDIKNPFDKDCINVVAAGRLTKQKGFDILIKSFKHVVEKNNAFRLYIIGENILNEKTNLENLAKKEGLENYISFLGFQKNPYRFFYYSNLYVLSSRWEGLPNTVLENLYLKKPVVATKCIPFMNTLIKHNKNGLLVDVGDDESLSKAILSYLDIDVSYKTVCFSNYKINNIFTEGK